VISIISELESDSTVVATRDLIKHYKKCVALKGLEITVPERSVYVLVGPNGAGKTTTIKILIDLVRADSGNAEVFGMTPHRDGARVRAQIGYIPENAGFGYSWLKVGRLLRYHASFYPSWDSKYEKSLLSKLKIDVAAKYGNLSKGQARQVQLVMALAHRPPFLLLDEPLEGLDPFVRSRVLEILAGHLADSPTTMLVSTHHIHELESLVDHIGVIDDGLLHAQMSCEQLHRRLRRYRVLVPEDWSSPPEIEPYIVERNEGDRETVWTVWGDESAVIERLVSTGATVRTVLPLGLEEAAVALLAGREGA